MGDWIPFVPNYTGPFISNGKFQTSVEFGDRKPKDKLDALSRLHDSAYARWGDSKLHRMAADDIYADAAGDLPGALPKVAGFAVRYGNHAQDGIKHVAKEAAKSSLFYSMPVLGLIKGGLDVVGTYSGYKRNRDELRREVVKYYGTDPHKHFQIGWGK